MLKLDFNSPVQKSIERHRRRQASHKFRNATAMAIYSNLKKAQRQGATLRVNKSADKVRGIRFN